MCINLSAVINCAKSVINMIIRSKRDIANNTDNIIFKWNSKNIQDKVNCIKSFKNQATSMIYMIYTKDELNMNLEILEFFSHVIISAQRKRINIKDKDIKDIIENIKYLLSILVEKQELFSSNDNAKIADLLKQINKIKFSENQKLFRKFRKFKTEFSKNIPTVAPKPKNSKKFKAPK